MPRGRRNRGAPGQPRGGGGAPKLTAQTELWDTWSQNGYWYVRYSVKVTRGLRLISNCRVQFQVNGTDEGQPETTNSAGTATHIYEYVDVETKTLVVGARIFDPDTGVPLDVRCTETIPLGEQVSGEVATKLRLGDEPSAEYRQTFPIFVYYDDKDGKPVPVKGAEVKAEVLGEEHTATSNDNGYAHLTLWIPGKYAWVTFSCGTYRERRRIRGHGFDGRLLLPPIGQPPGPDDPWRIRASYDLRLGANDGLEYRDESQRQPTTVKDAETVATVISAIPERVREAVTRNRWVRRAIAASALALPFFIIFFLLTWWLGLGWLIYFTLATVLAFAFYFSAQFRRGVGWWCFALNDRRLALLVLLLFLSCVQVYRLPWGKGIIEGVTERAATLEKPNTPLKRIYGYWAGREEESEDAVAKPAKPLTRVAGRSKLWQFFITLLTLFGTLVYAWRAKADNIRAAWEDYQLDKRYRAEVEAARKKGEAPPSRPGELSPFQHSLWVLLLAFLADFVFERLPGWLRGIAKESVQTPTQQR